MAGRVQSGRLTFGEALRDLGWLPSLFSTIVGGPSILALLQMVFEHRLTDALQWIVDGYNDITAKLGAVIEPLVRPMIELLNAIFDLNLDLQPHWRPVFLLGMVFVSGFVRGGWKADPVAGVFFGVLMSFAAFVAALGVGLLSLDGGWATQGWIAGLPFGAVTFALALPICLSMPDRTGKPSAVFGAITALVVTAFVTGLSFALGAGLTFVPGLSRGAGLVALGSAIVIFAIVGMAQSFPTNDLVGVRGPLIMLGGFFTAGIILAADAILRVL